MRTIDLTATAHRLAAQVDFDSDSTTSRLAAMLTVADQLDQHFYTQRLALTITATDVSDAARDAIHATIARRAVQA